MLSAEPVCSCAFCFAQSARETAGAARTRSSLRPLFSRAGSFQQTSGAMRREIAKLYPRRPGLEPGPIIPGGVLRKVSATAPLLRDHAVWVPAFAGTTKRERPFACNASAERAAQLLRHLEQGRVMLHHALRAVQARHHARRK